MATSPRKVTKKIRAIVVLLAVSGFFNLLIPNTLQARSEKLSNKIEEITASALEQYIKDIRENTEYLQLDNGIRVILHQTGFAPVASLYIKFLVGAYDEQENKKEFGISHMLEHMLFKGTKKIGTINYQKEEKYVYLTNTFAHYVDRLKEQYRQQKQENGELEHSAGKEFVHREKAMALQIANYQEVLEILKKQHAKYIKNNEDATLYQKHGGIGYNAYTSNDVTNYQVDLPSSRISLWAEIESDRMQNAIMRSFYTERDVVREERSLRIDNQPRYLLLEKFKKAIYQDSAYAHPVIGSRKDIKQLTHTSVERFYRQHYRPEKMVICIVGKFDSQEIKKLLQKTFGVIGKKQEDPKIRRQHAQIHKKMTDRQIKKRISQLRQKEFQPVTQTTDGPPIIYMAWLKPPYQNKGTQALDLDLLSDILTYSKDSRLYRRLVTQERLASEVSIATSYPGYRDINLFFIRIVPNGAQWDIKQIQAIVMEEIARPVLQTELSLARSRSRIGLISLESNGRKADILSSYEVLGNSYQELFSYYKKINKVSVKSLKKTSKEYLSPEKIMLAYTVSDQANLVKLQDQK